MGFRSTFVTTDAVLEVPSWFAEKWGDTVYLGQGNPRQRPLDGFPFASRAEIRAPRELAPDIQRILNEQDEPERRSGQIVLVWLHECGGITRVEIDRHRIRYTEPDTWRATDGITHDSCYGCSSADHALPSSAAGQRG